MIRDGAERALNSEKKLLCKSEVSTQSEFLYKLGEFKSQQNAQDIVKRQDYPGIVFACDDHVEPVVHGSGTVGPVVSKVQQNDDVYGKCDAGWIRSQEKGNKNQSFFPELEHEEVDSIFDPSEGNNPLEDGLQKLSLHFEYIVRCFLIDLLYKVIFDLIDRTADG